MIASLAALAIVPWAGWAAPPLGVLWAALVVQGTLGGRKELEPVELLRGTPGLVPLWGRSLAAAAFVALPFGVLLGVRYATLARPDVPGFRVLDEMAIALAVLLGPVNALLFLVVFNGLTAVVIVLLFRARLSRLRAAHPG